MNTRTLLACLAVASATSLAGSAVASAHVGVASTSPRHASTVRALPPVVAVTFTGAIARPGAVRITRNGRGNFAGGARLDPRSSSRLLITVKRPGAPALRRGVYRVAWNARAADGHAQRGVFAFRVR